MGKARYHPVVAIAAKHLTTVLLISFTAVVSVACTESVAHKVGNIAQKTEETQTESIASKAKSIAQTTEETRSNKQFLWEVESPQNTIYLLGSIHLLRKTDYPLSQSFQDAFDDAETVVFEVNLADSSSHRTQTLILQKARPDQGESLQASLSPETYDLAQQSASELGLPIAAFNQLEPWTFALTLVSFKLQRLGFESRHGVDRHFFEQATKAKKDIIALETLEEQLDLLDQLSAEEQEKFVHQTVLDLDNLEPILGTLVDAWKSGDITALEHLLFNSFQEYPELKAKFFDERNQRWVQQMEPWLQDDQDYLIVVGAGHLVGENSVIQLLQEKGYMAEQL